MDFLKRLKSGKVIVWDGACGTNAARLLANGNITPPSCNELLNLEHPEIVETIHREFIAAGAQVIETNTFGATRIVLAENDLENKFVEINTAAVKIAKRAANHRSRVTSHEVLVSASIGPTSKLPTLGHISFEEISREYEAQAKILASAGVDVFQVETCQDILQTKAAIVGIKRAIGKRSVPIVATITIEENGATLLGTDIVAAYTALAPLGIAAFGLNCATGPSEMEAHIKELARISELPIMVLPNAGLPEIVNGHAYYPLSPADFGNNLEFFVKKLGVQIVGGCCGTSPAHIYETAKRVTNLKVKPRKPNKAFFLSSLFSATNIEQRPAPLIVGERMNINGSKEFRELLLADNFDAACEVAKKQTSTGAHILDLNVAYAGRNESHDIAQMTARLAKISIAPIMIDSTDPEAIRSALERLPGRAVINSINLEDGGKKATKILSLAKEFGAGVVALTIDRGGMATTCAKKIAIAKKLLALCKKSGFFKSGGFILIDPLTFTLAEPRAAKFGSALETLKALKLLKSMKKSSPWVKTILGVSNVSYGLPPAARKILNSVFLHEAIAHGLDAAIVHPGQIVPLHKIDTAAMKLARALIYKKGTSPLEDLLKYFEAPRNATPREQKIKSTPKDELFSSIVDGNIERAKELAPIVAGNSSPSEAINKTLLPAMQHVGEMFGRQELALPFVLQSAEAMRAAIDSLAPFMDRASSASNGKIVLATVKGDVHDIGKNLVDIILSNNGFSVINLGVKQPVDAIIKAVEKEKPSAIGLSGLLVQSCLIMKDDLSEMAKRGVSVPIICGGAALTESFVKNELTKAYRGKVFYARDAFDGLRIMRSLQGGK